MGECDFFIFLAVGGEEDGDFVLDDMPIVTGFVWFVCLFLVFGLKGNNINESSIGSDRIGSDRSPRPLAATGRPKSNVLVGGGE